MSATHVSDPPTSNSRRERRKFLELVELASSHPEGVFVEPELDAHMDVERSEGDKIWVAFPALARHLGRSDLLEAVSREDFECALERYR